MSTETETETKLVSNIEHATEFKRRADELLEFASEKNVPMVLFYQESDGTKAGTQTFMSIFVDGPACPSFADVLRFAQPSAEDKSDAARDLLAALGF